MNNPTIDGVSRETVENAIEALTRHLAGHAPMQVPPSKADSDMVREELRALLDANHSGDVDEKVAPAVEWQEPVGELEIYGYQCRQSEQEKFFLCEYPQFWQHIALVRKDDADAQTAALQSTIAQLKARIAELESWRGEPVAYLRNEGVPNNLVVCGFDHPEAFKVFKTPPAPVAVQDPYVIHDAAFRNGVMHGYSLGADGSEDEYQKCISRLTDGLNAARRERKTACLDATAALKGVKS